MNQLRIATLKLTGWYLAILVIVCIAFSVMLYQISSQEFDRPLPPENQQSVMGAFSSETFRQIREQRALESKQNILTNLVMLNAVTLSLGAGLSYLFAKRTLRPVEEAMEAQARFTSDASHELRTPLAAIRAENEVALRDKKPSVSSLKALVASNLEEVERLQQLTDRLLALSSEQELAYDNFSLGQAAHDTALRHAALAKQKSITLKVTAKDLQAHGNYETTCDILSILIDNAIKYSPERTTVTISTLAQNNYVEVHVADQGPGIASEDAEHVFDRFYRADQSRSKQHVEGHGLGLALAKRLSDLNNATLGVVARNPRGSVFTLRLNKAK